jgi:ribosomal protein S27AE
MSSRTVGQIAPGQLSVRGTPTPSRTPYVVGVRPGGGLGTGEVAVGQIQCPRCHASEVRHIDADKWGCGNCERVLRLVWSGRLVPWLDWITAGTRQGAAMKS